MLCRIKDSLYIKVGSNRLVEVELAKNVDNNVTLIPKENEIPFDSKTSYNVVTFEEVEKEYLAKGNDKSDVRSEQTDDKTNKSDRFSKFSKYHKEY